MGTRSACGVRIDGADKLSYNQFDGYWSGVGQGILAELKADIAALELDGAIGTWKQKARTLRLVDGATAPTADQITACKPYTDLAVSRRSTDDWYCLLRGTQGSITKRLEAGFALDGNDFVFDSLFCEYAYVLNLDDETLELYVGFQKAEHSKGRYAATKEKDGEYWPVALVHTIKLVDLPAIDDLQAYLEAAGVVETDQ